MPTVTKRRSFDELVDLESREIARDMLEKQLRDQDLPLPSSGLDIHIDALLRVDPTILKSATNRVEARMDAYSKALRAIGVDDTPLESLEL